MDQFYIINVNLDTISKDVTEFTALLSKANLTIRTLNILVVLNIPTAHSYFLFNNIEAKENNRDYFNYIILLYQRIILSKSSMRY